MFVGGVFIVGRYLKTDGYGILEKCGPLFSGERSDVCREGELLRNIPDDLIVRFRAISNSIGEFDPGSGRTLAACLIHASRTRSVVLAPHYDRVANG